MYAFAAALGGTRVLDAARALARQSGIPARRLTLVDRHKTYAHNDPNSAAPAKNAFLKRLIPFLRSVARGAWYPTAWPKITVQASRTTSSTKGFAKRG